MITAGIDVGSVATKAVVLRDGELAGKALLRTGAEPRTVARRAYLSALTDAGLDECELPSVVTGYGRVTAQMGGRTVTEILSAARGAYAVAPHADGVIDLGGQDTKVIRLGPEGVVTDFAMNDKCAAGTGRFLELMASALGTDLDGLGDLAEGATEAVRINSTCAVFAESEVVSLIARGVSRSEIVAGLFAAIASRVTALAAQVGEAGCYAFIGGGARSRALRNALEAALGKQMVVPAHPQYVVALGAALVASKD